jgi:putative ATP-dependent endonuclease of OLD family
MARIRHLQISNFRCIEMLDWYPSQGINCLVGPGDSGKSTVLDAIDLCLGARRAASLSDTDFHDLDVDSPISISITIGDLPRELLNIESYGDYLRGFDSTFQSIEDEPGNGLEPVLTLRLIVESDLEPNWLLYSKRMESEGIERNLRWKDRQSVAPVRIGNYAASNLSWTRGSVLNKLTDTKVQLGSHLVAAARKARLNFGAQVSTDLHEPLDVASKTAKYLGVNVGDSVQALLDAHSVSMGDGAIALHSAAGVPLRSLGTGSARLLVAGLQRVAADAATIALVDEVEHGLEPHRLCRLLDTLGAKDDCAPLQVFMTTHSPVVVRELEGSQVFVIRKDNSSHDVLRAGRDDEVQSTLRADPEAFLARSILVCEGASEVGLARGLDQNWSTEKKLDAFPALGGAYVNVNGGEPDNCFKRASALLRLGYRVMVMVDADKPADPKIVKRFLAAGGEYVTWEPKRTLEDELFMSLPGDAVSKLLDKAVSIKGRTTVNNHIVSTSNGRVSLDSIEDELASSQLSDEARRILGEASRVKKNGWFKSVTYYQDIGRHIVGPCLERSAEPFQRKIAELSKWTHAA